MPRPARAACPPLLDVPPGRTAPVHPTTAAEVRAALTRAPGGCWTLDLRPCPVSAPGPIGTDGWRAGVGPVARFFDVVVTDWGLRPDLGPVLDLSDAVCLVVDAGTPLPALPPGVVVATAGARRRLRLAAELMRPTGGASRDR